MLGTESHPDFGSRPFAVQPLTRLEKLTMGMRAIKNLLENAMQADNVADHDSMVQGAMAIADEYSHE